jgi:hypothetical protein
MDIRICHAIEGRRLLMFGYGDAVRVVEPHLYGVTTTGQEALSGWLRPGWSRVDPDGGWRTFHADALENLQLLPERYAEPRAGFNPRDPHFVEVFCAASAKDGAGGEVGPR